MQFDLTAHPSTPPADPPFRLWVSVDYAGTLGAAATLNLWFGIAAPAKRFVIPQADDPGRADELWKTTCCETFLRHPGEEHYAEWNFAPSGDWAAYEFSAYRAGMASAPVRAAPYVRIEDNLTWWALGATLSVDAGTPWELGLSAVIEEKDGTKSYWALAHDGDTPDFHQPSCFVARLP